VVELLFAQYANSTSSEWGVYQDLVSQRLISV
jgi:hypothetical protein